MAMIKSDNISINQPPIQRISVHSSRGVKKLYPPTIMLPLCAERQAYYSTTTVDPRTSSSSYHSEQPYSRLYHTLSNSDSAYYSSLSNTVPIYPIHSNTLSLPRDGNNKKKKRRSQHRRSNKDTNENETYETHINLMQPQYLSLPYPNYSHQQQQSHFNNKINERQNYTKNIEKALPSFSSMPTTTAATVSAAAFSSSPQQQQSLYSALLPPRHSQNQNHQHDPNQPSTSKASAMAESPTAKVMVTKSNSNGISLPPNLLRIVNSTNKIGSNKLRLYLKLNETDATNPKISFEFLPTEYDSTQEPQFVFTVGSHKLFSSETYDLIFPPKTSQTDICINCLPELLQTLFAGFDATLMYFGAISRQKQDLLYSRFQYSPSSNGIFVCAIQWIFKLIEEYRLKKKDIRYSIRISALHYSQKSDKVIDLLSDFANEDNSENEVKCTEDPALGILIENRSEIRVETVDQALYYLDRVHDHRASEDEEIQRSSHTFFYLTLYRYETQSTGLLSGKSRLCFIDLGLGEKNSKTGYMTMPVLGQILLSIFQGQKHLPSRQNTLCRLLKESVGNSKNKATTVISTYSPVENRCPIETENLVQLASKMHKIANKSNTASPNHHRASFKGDYYRHPPPPLPPPMDAMEYTSSSEQSCAETVIYVGPQQHQQNHQNSSQPSSSSIGYNGASLPPPSNSNSGPSSSIHSPLKRRSSKGSKGSSSFGSNGRKSNTNISGHSNNGAPISEPQQPMQVIPIDCPPNAIIHSSASFQSLSVHNSPKRPTNLFQRIGNSMPGTPVLQNRSSSTITSSNNASAAAARQSSVPSDLILCNPMARTMSPKNLGSNGNGNSLKRTKKQKENNLEDEFYNIDPEKRDMVLNWIIEQKVEYGTDICGIGKPFPNEPRILLQRKVDVSIQCNEDEIDAELLNVWNQARFLDDIVEDEEEASTASASVLTRSLTTTNTNGIINGIKREALAEKLPSNENLLINNLNEKQSLNLNILSKESDILGELGLLAFERLSIMGDDENENEENESVEISDDELEKAMAASISSIKSHEILSKMVTEFPNNEIATTSLLFDSFTASAATDSTKVPTEMDFYRRASHLEAYAAERLKELQAMDKNKKDFISNGIKQVKDAISKQLHCAATSEPEKPSTMSINAESCSSTFYNKKPDNLGPTKKKEETSLLSKFKLKQLSSCCHAMTTSSTSSASIGTNTIQSSFNNSSPFKTIKVSTTTTTNAPITKTKTMATGKSSKKEGHDDEEERSESTTTTTTTKIVSPLPPEIAKQITDQLRNAGLGKAPSHIPAATTNNNSLLQKPKNVIVVHHSQSSCSSPIRSGIPQSASYSLKDLRKASTTTTTTATNNSSRTRKDSAESVSRKLPISKGKSRRNSADSAKSSTIVVAAAGHGQTTTNTTTLPSPYSKVTTAKIPISTNSGGGGGAYSSGHGSDETNSNSGNVQQQQHGTTLLPRPIIPSGTSQNMKTSPSKIPSGTSLLLNGGNNKNRPRNRESFSASSGYESGDYGKYRNATATIPSPDLIIDFKLKKPTTSSSTAIIIAQKEIASLKQLRDSLKSQLSDAKLRLGLDEDVIIESDEKYIGLAAEIVIDLLTQETRQLEKRLIACQNRILMVTTFL